MALHRHNGREISPSLVSKAKHALGLKRTHPLNDKLCSQELWEEVVEIVGGTMNCPHETVQRAKAQYHYYMEPYFI